MIILSTNDGKIVLNEYTIEYAKITETDNEQYKVTIALPIGTYTLENLFKSWDEAKDYLVGLNPDLEPVTMQYIVNLKKVLIAKPHKVADKIIAYTIVFNNYSISVAADWLLDEFVKNHPQIKELLA